MNNTQHTPGPTCTCGVITTVIETGIGCYDENEIAQCPLCKAAPAMYEALKACLESLRVAMRFDDGDVFGVDHNDTVDAMGLAETTLAQAEGKP